MESKTAKVDPDLIHLHGVRILRAHYELDENIHEEARVIADFQIGLKSQTSFNYDINQIRFVLFIKIIGLDQQGEKTGAKGEYSVEYSYLVENLNDFVEGEADQKMVSSMLGATIAGISYSTARGIVLDRTQATDFNGVLLPIINPHRLLSEDSFTDL